MPAVRATTPYAELAVSPLEVIVTIDNIYCAYPRRDGQAELAWVAH